MDDILGEDTMQLSPPINYVSDIQPSESMFHSRLADLLTQAAPGEADTEGPVSPNSKWDFMRNQAANQEMMMSQSLDEMDLNMPLKVSTFTISY